MADYTAASMQCVTSTGAPVKLPLTKRIVGIKYFAGVNSSAALLSGATTSTGAQIWFENKTGAGTNIVDLLSIYDPDGVTVSLGGGAVLFIYGAVARQ